MKPLILKAFPITGEDEKLSIQVLDRKDKVIAIVWADKQITFSENEEYYLDEIKQMGIVAENFYLFYNNLANVPAVIAPTLERYS